MGYLYVYMKLFDIILLEYKGTIAKEVGNLIDQWKGKSASDFVDQHYEVYEWAVKKGPFIIDPITGKKKNTKGFWENLIKDMDQTEFKNRLDNKKRSASIPKEEIIKVADEFGNGLVSDFKRNFRKYYQAAVSKGPFIKIGKNKFKNTFEFFYEATKNMVRTQRDPFTDDELRDIAKKYIGKTLQDFRDGDPSAYEAALDRGPCTDGNRGPCKEKDNRKNTYEFFKEITKDIKPTGSYSNKMVYVYEFRDENNNPVAAYVGLTDKGDVRHKEHMTGVTREGKPIETSVTKFIKENPNLHFTKLNLTDGYIDWESARKLEDEYEKKYENNGWKILNVAKTGSLGRSFGVSNDELKKRFDKYNTVAEIRKKDSSAYRLAWERGILDDLTKNYKKLKTLRTDQELIDFALSYDTFADFKKDSKAESIKVIARNRGLIPKIIELFKEKGDNPIYIKKPNRSNQNESKLSFKNTIIEMIQHDVDEIATKEKELVGKGAFHNVYPSNKNPNMVYKIGFDEDVNGWVDLFKSRPDIFPKVYSTGHVNIKLKKQVTNFSWRTGEFKPITYNPGDTVKVKYVGVERLNTEKAKQHWNSLANVVSVMSGKSLQTYLTSLGMDEEMEEEFLSIGERIKETGNDFIYKIFVEFYNLIHSVYELKPVADVHVGNYGYDKDGNLKCLDI